tara:strand:+ start:1242 stop:1508 length:267 start_codon:yes stop_codon:yes gene_type:complete
MNKNKAENKGFKMLNIIKRLDKITDDLNSLKVDSNLADKLYNISKEVGEVKKQISKPIEIYRNNRWIYDVQPSYSWTVIDNDKPCDTE